MGDSRTKNTTRNIYSGLFNKMVSILLPFLNRTIILWTLGAEFTGLSGLFSSILSVLSIAELGFNSAVVYSLYKPMAERDEAEINKIVTVLKKVYSIVGTVILGLGIVVSLFLTNFIHGNAPDTVNIYIIFYLELVNSAISYYLFAYKECLLLSDQRADVGNKIRAAVSIVRYLVQGAILLLTRNYYVYLCIALIGTVATNLLIQRETKKRYPFFHIDKSQRGIPKGIAKQVSGLMVDKLSNTCRNSFDSLIISSFIGLTATAIYGNYYYIYNALYGIMLVICNAMSASVGNSIIKKSTEENYNDLNKFTYLFSWILGWTTVCLFCLYQPFMKLWAGNDFLLSELNMSLFCIYYFWINMTNIRNQYISGTGMWWRLKYLYIAEAISNLLFNIILGKILGITGVIIATIVTIIGYNCIAQTIVLFKYYFTSYHPVKYLLRQFIYFLITAVIGCVTIYVCKMIPFQGVLCLLIRMVICIIVPNCIFIPVYMRMKYYSETKSFLGKIKRTIIKK